MLGAMWHLTPCTILLGKHTLRAKSMNSHHTLLPGLYSDCSWFQVWAVLTEQRKKNPVVTDAMHNLGRRSTAHSATAFHSHVHRIHVLFRCTGLHCCNCIICGADPCIWETRECDAYVNGRQELKVHHTLPTTYPHSLQHTAYNIQLTTNSFHHTANNTVWYNKQLTTHSLQHRTYSTQPTT